MVYMGYKISSMAIRLLSLRRICLVGKRWLLYYGGAIAGAVCHCIA